MTTTAIFIAIGLALLALVGVFWFVVALAVFIGAATMEDAHDDYPFHEDFQEKR